MPETRESLGKYRDFPHPKSYFPRPKSTFPQRLSNFYQWLSAFLNVFLLSSTAFQFSSTAFHFLINPRKSIYGGKYPKDCYSSFIFPTTCSPSFIIPATMSTSPPTDTTAKPEKNPPAHVQQVYLSIFDPYMGIQKRREKFYGKSHMGRRCTHEKIS